MYIYIYIEIYIYIYICMYVCVVCISGAVSWPSQDLEDPEAWLSRRLTKLLSTADGSAARILTPRV